MAAPQQRPDVELEGCPAAALVRPCRWLLRPCDDDDEVVLRPPNRGLKAGLTKEVEQFVRAADDALCAIDRSRLGERSVRFHDIRQQEPSALRQSLCDTGEQVGLRRNIDVMQGKCGNDQLEGPFRQSILEAAEPQLCSRPENIGRDIQLVPALIEAHGARRRMRLQTPSCRFARADPQVEHAAHLQTHRRPNDFLLCPVIPLPVLIHPAEGNRPGAAFGSITRTAMLGRERDAEDDDHAGGRQGAGNNPARGAFEQAPPQQDRDDDRCDERDGEFDQVDESRPLVARAAEALALEQRRQEAADPCERPARDRQRDDNALEQALIDTGEVLQARHSWSAAARVEVVPGPLSPFQHQSQSVTARVPREGEGLTGLVAGRSQFLQLPHHEGGRTVRTRGSICRSGRTHR